MPVLVDLWTPRCGPRRAVAPVVERLARRHAGRRRVVRVNAYGAPRVAAHYRASGIPTLLVRRDGRELERVVGVLPGPALDARPAPHLPPPRPAAAGA